jgi:hypothetical protein
MKKVQMLHNMTPAQASDTVEAELRNAPRVNVAVLEGPEGQRALHVQIGNAMDKADAELRACIENKDMVYVAARCAAVAHG